MLTVVLLAQVVATSPAPPVRRYPIEVKLTARVHRLWNPADQQQLAVAPFSLAVPLRWSGDSVGYGVELRPETNTRPSRDTPAHLELFARGGTTRTLGVVAGPVPAEPDFWRVVARQAGMTRENLATFRLSRLREGNFALSDLVVGAAGQGVSWALGADTVTLAPDEVLLATERIQLFYQIRSTRPLSDLCTKMTVTRVVAQESQADQVFTLGFRTPRVPAGITSVQREIDATRLTGSRYRIDVIVTTADGTFLGATRGMLELVR